MTTSTIHKKMSRKPLRIRPEFLPESAKYATIDDTEYVLIPVKDFAEWYEDIEDRAVGEYVRDDPTPAVPGEEMMRRVNDA